MHRIATAVVAVVLLAGCTGGQDTTATDAATAATTETPSAAATPASEPSAEPTGGVTEVLAWYVRLAPTTLYVEPVRRQLAEPTVGVAAAAIIEVLTGDPEDPALTTLAPEGTRLLGASIADGVLTVDLSAEVRENPNVGAAGEAAFAQQLAFTGAQFDTVEAVEVRVEGEPVTDLWGHVDWSEPLRPDEFQQSPVVVLQPGWGETVEGGEVTLAGTANTFEATVELRLVDPDGAVVSETFTTATCGTGCRGEWTHTFSAVEEPGRWAVVAAAPDPSGGEGPDPFVTETVFEVR